MAVIRNHWPVAAAIGIFSLIVLALFLVSWGQNDGRFVYALDDAYIHMGMAKHFAQAGVWGVTPYGFSSSSSSPLWTLLLAGVYRVTGVHAAVPFLLNVLAALGVIVLVYRIGVRHGADPVFMLIVLLSMILFAPLPTLVFSGMEHALQILLSLAFFYLSARVLSQCRQDASVLCSGWHGSVFAAMPLPGAEERHGRDDVILVLLAAGVTAIRYEGLFLVAAVCLLLLLQRRVTLALAVGIMALLPVMIYGLISVSNGWYFFPNSIILKGQTPDLFSLRGAAKFLFTSGSDTTAKVPHVFSLVALALIVFLFRSNRARGLRRPHTLMILVFALTALLHIQFAKVGWFYRYEAYLVAMFILTLSLCVWEDLSRKQLALNLGLIRRHKGIVLVVALVLAPFFGRGILALKETPQAMNDRYLTHIALAQFIHAFYDRSTVVVNDIGTFSYYTGAKTLDLFGLGSKEPVAFRRQSGGYTDRDVRRWAGAQSAEIAILMTQWAEVAPRIPPQWIPVGEWTLPRNVIFGDTAVGFFAVDPAAQRDLIEHLKTFAPRVSPMVRQKGIYTGSF